MSSDKLKAIKDILEAHPGKRNQISSGEIGRLIGINEDATHVKTRTLIRQTIDLYNIPVGGSHKGYYMIENEEELNTYCGNIERRIEKMNQRKEKIRKNFMGYSPVPSP